MPKITDKEWNALERESFQTSDLLRVLDAVDELREMLSDDTDGRPPELRDDILRLHGLAMAVFNEGSRRSVPDLFERANDLEDQLDTIAEAVRRIQAPLRRLLDLYPESLSYGESDD
jgi:hypothetical protein